MDKLKSWTEYNYLPKDLSINKEDFLKLWETRNRKYNKIKIYGRWCESKRFQNCYGKDYKFSGNIIKAKPIPESLIKYIKYFSEKYNYNFNMCLLNFYEDGNHYISMHSDNEKELIVNTPVITITFLEDNNQPRKFVIQKNDTKAKEIIKLENNSYFVMGGTFQKEFKHGIPKEKKINTKRISITLRVFK